MSEHMKEQKWKRMIFWWENPSLLGRLHYKEQKPGRAFPSPCQMWNLSGKVYFMCVYIHMYTCVFMYTHTSKSTWRAGAFSSAQAEKWAGPSVFDVVVVFQLSYQALGRQKLCQVGGEREESCIASFSLTQAPPCMKRWCLLPPENAILFLCQCE